jgi:hypothetical protein
LALASFGIVVGHTLTYWAVSPDGEHREALLASTGHAYWGAAVGVGVMGALWAVAAQIIRGIRLATSSADREVARGSFATRLALLQVVGFVVTEVIERVAAGEPISMTALLEHDTLLLGIVVQLAVALTLGRIIEWVGETTRRVAEWLSGRPVLPSVQPVRWSASDVGFPATEPPRAGGIRGPPQVSSSFS